MIYKKIKFTEDYQALVKTERVWKDGKGKNKKGKPNRVMVEENGKPKLKKTYKTIHRKGDIAIYDGAMADQVCNVLKIATVVEILLPRMVNIPLEFKDRVPEVIQAGIDKLRQKPAPAANKMAAGPQKNK